MEKPDVHSAPSAGTPNRRNTKTSPPLQPESSSRKGINANHLLNFSLPARAVPTPYRHSSSSHHGASSSSAVKYQRDRFLRAKYSFDICCRPLTDSYRLMVSSLGDYLPNLLDPDTPLPWAQVDFILITTNSEPSCPICLCPPQVPRVSRCGHVYCCSCMLHYLALEETKYRSCPLCSEKLCRNELKPCRFISATDEGLHGSDTLGPSLSADSVDPAAETDVVAEKQRKPDVQFVKMKLMMRTSGSTNAFPRALWHGWAATAFACIDSLDSPYLNYAKISIPSPALLMALLIDNREQLERLRRDAASAGDREEVVWLEMTSQYIDEKINTLSMEMDARVAAWQRKRARGEQAADASSSSSKTKLRMSDLALPPAALELAQKSPLNNFNAAPPQSSDSSPSVAPFRDGMYYFYQASTGQHIYLHPLDIKILKKQFGAYDRFPDEIILHVANFDEMGVTEDFRKKAKYLSHLPLSCHIALAELDWTSLSNHQLITDDKTLKTPLVTAATLREFQLEIKARTRARKVAEGRNKPRRKSSPPPNTTSFMSPERESSTLVDDLATLSLSMSFPALPSPEPLAVQGNVAVTAAPTEPLSSTAQTAAETLSPDENALRSFAQILTGQQAAALEHEEGQKKRGKRGKKVVLLSTGGTRR